MKMLVNLLKPTSGQARILNRPLNDVSVRKKVGFLPENFRYHDWLTGEDLLRFHAALFRMDPALTARRISEVLAMVGLADYRRQQVGGYSKGMQQRIGLACALLPDPDLLLLDEPTSALDPVGRKEIRDLLLLLRDQGKTVFLNSHLLSELETVCDQIAIIKKGGLVFQGDWRELTARDVRLKVIIAEPPSPGLNTIYDLGFEVRTVNRLRAGQGGVQEVVFACPESDRIPQLITELVNAGFRVYEATPVVDSLEQLFLQYVKDA